ncbi:hypothetical protein ONS95_012426 [Cadophora gregata]|uniref:uncharacterized protein n=1 Tax=Cadophora gregata TaxID=51156 RepID=UPI0026DA9999|nr:uncharacterized protein ONS95_012426 [Cadophora gregata]KAK0118121.1 hypothetical protein ONS95_012426 [Cadophora gregata]KAK0123191.1 hypothetical protein ONS96_010191 [Cadophora gregata f. sp. sojae]
MRSTILLPAGLTTAILLAYNTAVYAHTWVEELRLVASNGSFVGAPGYIRNFGPRIAGVDPNSNLWLLPPNGRGNAFLPTDLMCRSTQVKPQQTPDYPTLTAAPGDHIALRYLENGHVTLFTTQPGKPAGRGTVFIYATKQSQETDTYLGIHRVWNTEGTGGDKRGKLIATRPFDDGQCFQRNGKSGAREAKVGGFTAENGGSDLLCQNDFKIPSDAGTSGSYTLYWVWEWPTLNSNGDVVTNESYTSCMDISLTSKGVPAAGKFVAQTAGGKAANSVGIEAQLGDEQFLINPTAPPQPTSDDLPVGATGVPVPKPKPDNGAADPKSGAPALTKSKTIQPTPTSPPAQGFKTVTVTAKEIETVYVTGAPSSSPTSSPRTSFTTAANTVSVVVVTSTVTVRPPGATASSSAPPVYNSAFSSFTAVPMSSVLATAIPTPSPFLTPDNEVQQAGAGAAAADPATSSSSYPTPAGRQRRSRIERRSVEK